jgi:phosphoglycolate phosphatase
MTKINSTITNVLFDLDGTLADTAPDLAVALNRLLVERGKPELPFGKIRPMVSHGGVYMLCRAFAVTDTDPEFPALRERFLEIYASNLADATRLFPGMPEVLDRIEALGYTWGIVTNKMERLTRPLVVALNLDHRAACVVCGDTLNHSKPHPAPMLHACQLIACAPEQTLYIGDAEKDVIAGNSAHMHTLIARYGYISDEDAPENWGADGVIDTPLEILDWLDLATREP